MIGIPKSMSMWLLLNYKELYIPISFGHFELFTEEMKKEFLEWIETDEGLNYFDEYWEEDKQWWCSL